jgi:hypothetical protein
VLDVYERIGQVGASAAQASMRLEAKLDAHVAEDRAEFRRMRGKVASFADDAEATGKHILAERARWSATTRRIVWLVASTVAGAATALVTYLLAVKG